MNPQEFAQKIKAKYPQYQGVDDLELTKQVIQKYPQYQSQVDMTQVTPQRQGFIQETIQDVRETGQGIAQDISERADTTGDIAQAQERGEQGFLRSAFQRFGQGAGAVSDVIGRAVTGAGKALLPQRAEEAIGGAFEAGVERVAEIPQVQNILSRFQEIKQTDPALARDIDAALGISTLGLDVATAGLGGRATKTAVKGVGKAGDIAGSGISKAGSLARRGVFEIEGALTGTSQETLEEAFRAARTGGKQLDDFTASLRGQVTPEQLVDNVRDATNVIQARKTQNFTNAFEPIADTTVTVNVRDSVASKLKDFGITVSDDGTLNFANSKFRRTPQAQAKISQMFDEVSRLTGDKTLREIDTTRQVLRELTLTGDDASARSANALITDAINSVRTSGKQVDGYGDLLAKFGEDAEFLTELQRSLATGDRATIDTAYRRLATSLKTNNERRMNLIRELDEVTGGALLGEIAGQQLSEVLPRGLFRQIAAGMVGAGAVTGGVSTSILPALVFASPKVVGEVIRGLGLTARKADAVIEAINNARKVIEDLNIKLPLGSLVVDGVENNLQPSQ